MTNTLAIARDPETPGKKLMTMLTHSDQAVREALASNPNLPKKGLLRLLGEFPAQVLGNPAMALLMLEDARLFLKAPEELQIEWASNANTPAWLLAMLCDLRRNGVREALASNRSTPAESLAGLAFPGQFAPAPQDDDDDWCDAQYAVLGHPSIPEGLYFDIKRHLESEEPDYDDYFSPLDDEEPEPYGLDPETEHTWCFSIDEDDEIDALPLNRDEAGVYYLPSSDGVVWGVDAVGSEDERWGCWDNEDEKSLWGSDWRDLAENPATPAHLLARMMRHSDPEVRAGAALRPELSAGDLAALALDPALEVRLAVAKNPSTGADTLALLAQSESYCIRCAVAAHRTTDRETLKKLANDPWNGVRATSLRNTHLGHASPMAQRLLAA